MIDEHITTESSIKYLISIIVSKPNTNIRSKKKTVNNTQLLHP